MNYVVNDPDRKTKLTGGSLRITAGSGGTLIKVCCDYFYDKRSCCVVISALRTISVAHDSCVWQYSNHICGCRVVTGLNFFCVKAACGNTIAFCGLPFDGEHAHYEMACEIP